MTLRPPRRTRGGKLNAEACGLPARSPLGQLPDKTFTFGNSGQSTEKGARLLMGSTASISPRRSARRLWSGIGILLARNFPRGTLAARNRGDARTWSGAGRGLKPAQVKKLPRQGTHQVDKKFTSTTRPRWPATASVRTFESTYRRGGRTGTRPAPPKQQEGDGPRCISRHERVRLRAERLR